MRNRLLRETEVILYFGLRFPGRIPRIPTVEVGGDRFDPDFSSQYWSHRLGLNSADASR